MDLVYLAIMSHCGVRFWPNENYVFILNMDDEVLYVNETTIYPDQIFVLPEYSARPYMRDVLAFRKIAVITYLVRGEEQPWS
jgi:hypothetical protein